MHIYALLSNTAVFFQFIYLSLFFLPSFLLSFLPSFRPLPHSTTPIQLHRTTSILPVAMASNSSCLPANDDLFGPAVQACRDNFDFTLLFEQAILSIGPSTILLLLTPFRIFQLAGCSVKTLHTPLLAAKAVGDPSRKMQLGSVGRSKSSDVYCV
jgi:hypothetical protein